MKTVKLKGISGKGKSRVNAFGDIWEIIKEETGFFFGSFDNWMLVRPCKTPDADLRWIARNNDKDFITNI